MKTRKAKAEIKGLNEEIEEKVDERTKELAEINAALNAEIAERRQAEEALNAQALRYKTLMETSTDSIYVVNGHGDLQEANAAFLQQRGYTGAEVKKLNIADWDAQWSRDQLQERIRQLVDSSAVFETRHRGKDGSVFDVEVSATSVRIGGEQFFFCVTRDITERKKAEASLRQLAQVSAASSDYIALIGSDFRYQFVNDVYLKARRRRAEDMVGRHMREVIGQKRFEQLGRPQVEAALRGEEVEAFEWTDFGAGRRCFLHVKVAPLREPDGTISGAVMSGRDITERTEAEQARHVSDRRFRQIAENINEVFWVWTATRSNSRCLYVSPAYETVWGRSRESLYSSPGSWKKALHPEDKERVLARIPFLNLETMDDVTYRIVRPDQSIRWIRDRIFPVRDESGTVVRVAGIAEDITEAKEAEQALRESEVKYRELVELTHDLVWSVDTEGRITFMSPASRRIYGREPEEMIGHLYTEFVPPDEGRRGMEHLGRMLATGDSVIEVVNRVLHRDGHEIVLSSNAVVLRNEKGNAVGSTGTSRDITERERAEERLQEYEKVVEGLEEMIVVVDRDYRYLLANRAYLKYRGLAREQVVGRLAAEINKGASKNLVKKKLDECLQGKPVEYEMRCPYPDRGERDLLISYFPIEGPAGIDRVACVLKDITERKQAEEQLQKAHRELQVLSRRLFEVQENERRHLARELHDEIGQALTAAKINLQSVARKGDSASLARLQETIAILDQLLSQVRKISLDLRPSMLDDLGLVPALRSLLDQQARRANVEIQFSVTKFPENLESGIQTTCFRIAQESITNALRHAKATRIDVDLECAQENLRLLIRDNGAGFDVEAGQAHKPGLGMIGIKERAALAGGSAQIISAPNSGTTIEVFLPLRPAGEREVGRAEP